MTPRRFQRIVPSALRRVWFDYQSSDFKWRYVDNLSPWLAFSLHRPKLDDERARVVSDLERDGIAITSLDRIFANDQPLHALETTIAQMEERQQSAVKAAREAAGAEPTAHKSYLYSFLPRPVTLPSNHGFVTFARSRPLQEIADVYFGMRTDLRQVNVWYNFATRHAPSASQFWHRDREDRSILKVFVYLDEVTEDRGPLTYAPGTHRSQGRDPVSFREPGHKNPRSTDDQMSAVVTTSQWRTAIGPKGTVVFADTSGFHKGGDVSVGERHVFVCMFTSPACRERLLFVEDPR